MNDLERRLYQRYGWFQLGYNLLFILVWYLSIDGLAFWDDYTYLNFANQINNGFFEISRNHFTSRVGLLYPLAWIIRWTGIDAVSITLYPMVCGLLLLNLVMWYGRRNALWVGLLAGLLIICDYHVLHFSTHLFPELPMALCIMVALLCYDMVNRKDGDHRFLALFTAMALFAAFLIKTTVFLLIPLFLFLFFNDRLRRRRNGSYWMITILCLAFFLTLNLFHYYEIKGDAFYRFENISTNHEPTIKTYFDKPWSETLRRLTYQPFIGFLRGGFFVPFLLALPAVLTLRKRDWRLDDPTKLWTVSFFLILASWWFMSTNWEYYSPMPVDTRHITFLIPLMILAGLHWWTKSILFEKLKSKKWPLLLSLFLLLIPFYKISQADDRNFQQLEELFDEQLLAMDKTASKGSVVFTDGLISYGAPYFYDFKKASLEYRWWSEVDKDRVKLGDYLLINPPFLNERYDDLQHLEELKAIISNRGWVLSCQAKGNVQLCEVQP